MNITTTVPIEARHALYDLTQQEIEVIAIALRLHDFAGTTDRRVAESMSQKLSEHLAW